MFDSVDELLRKIRLGEDNLLELKTVEVRGNRVYSPNRDAIADELAAFANTRDGVILFGVQDRPPREVLGIALEHLDLVENWARDICQALIEPPLDVQIIRLELPDTMGVLRAVLKVDVPRSLFVHHSPGGYYRRVGSAKSGMKTDVLARLLQQRSQARLIRFDEQIVPGTRAADLTPEWSSRFCSGPPEAQVDALHKRKVLAMEEGEERVTVTGVLLCTSQPERWLPGASARAAAFRGVHMDSNHQLDAADISGPVDQQILSLYAFAKRNMKRWVQTVPNTQEVSQYSDRALFEAIVNAVVHRDYSIYGSRIRMFLFDDRLELYSPGALPNTLSVDSIAFRQSTRNEALKSMMVKLPVGEAGAGSGRGFFMEAQGEGVPVIVRETRALAGVDATWRVIDDSEVLLTIPAANPPAVVIE